MPLGRTSCDLMRRSVSICSFAKFAFFEWSCERKTFISIYGISFKTGVFPFSIFSICNFRVNGYAPTEKGAMEQM